MHEHCAPRLEERRLRDVSSSPDPGPDEYYVDETQMALLMSQFPELNLEQAKEAIRGAEGNVNASVQLIRSGAVDLYNSGAHKEAPTGMNREVKFNKKENRWRWSTTEPM